jgi:ferric-dicitrate binding protein FerR (iron transport regulator)
MVMKPGELVEFRGGKRPIRKDVDASNYSAWKNNKLVFSRTSLSEIAQLMEDNYGYTVIFEKPEIAERNFTGTSSSENLEELFEKISIVFELDIKQEAKTLTIQYKKETPNSTH